MGLKMSTSSTGRKWVAELFVVFTHETLLILLPNLRVTCGIKLHSEATQLYTVRVDVIVIRRQLNSSLPQNEEIMLKTHLSKGAYHHTK